MLSAGELSNNSDLVPQPSSQLSQNVSSSSQTLTTAPLATVYEAPPSPVKEVFSYNKGVQTTELWPANLQSSQATDGDAAEEEGEQGLLNAKKPTNKRERDREEQLRQKIRSEVEEELKATRDLITDRPLNDLAPNGATSFPTRTLTEEEMKAAISSDDFMDFLERSSKVIERALDQDYNILSDYALSGADGVEDDNDEEFGGGRNKSQRRVKEVAQFYDQRWSKKRMISAIDFSPKYPELVLAAYTKNPTAPHEPDGIVQVWNMHLHDRPEFIFHAQSDVISAKFSPFHPNLIVGGAYSGQVMLWDTRAKSFPVQKTPLTGSGHTHPVYAVDLVGTQNANNIISCSTDGVVCGWTVDMLAQPQEYLTLNTPPPAKTEDLSPTCMAFPQTDPTYFLVGSEEGTIYSCHRYDRAGAKAGVDQRVSYRGHAAPVMSMDFHPSRGPMDLGDLVLTSSLDWSVKLWKIRAPAASSTTTATSEGQAVTPLLDFSREDVVYDAAWSPVKPGVFSLVDGAGNLEIWDITVETEVPLARVQPSQRKGGRSLMSKSLNKVAWEPSEGKRLATGGIDGMVTVFEVGLGLGGKDSARNEEWASVKKLVARLESAPPKINSVNGIP